MFNAEYCDLDHSNWLELEVDGMQFQIRVGLEHFCIVCLASGVCPILIPRISISVELVPPEQWDMVMCPLCRNKGRGNILSSTITRPKLVCCMIFWQRHSEAEGRMPGKPNWDPDRGRNSNFQERKGESCIWSCPYLRQHKKVFLVICIARIARISRIGQDICQWISISILWGLCAGQFKEGEIPFLVTFHSLHDHACSRI